MTEDPLVAACAGAVVCGSQPLALTAERPPNCSPRRSSASTRWACGGCGSRSAGGPARVRAVQRRPGIASALVGAGVPADLPGDLGGPVAAAERALLGAGRRARRNRRCRGSCSGRSGRQTERRKPVCWRPASAVGCPANAPTRASTRCCSCIELAAERVSLVPGAGLGADLWWRPPWAAGSVDEGTPGVLTGGAEGVAVISAHADQGSWSGTWWRWPGCRRGAGPGSAVRPDDLLGGDRICSTSRPGAAGRRVPGTAEVLARGAAAVLRRRHPSPAAPDGHRGAGHRRNPAVRFLAELAGDESAIQGWPQSEAGRDRRSLHVAELVADLRRALCDPATSEDDASSAAAQLARLAAAGVPGANPGEWYGLGGPSTIEPAIPPGESIAVSPSAVEALASCSLKAILERRGARKPTGDPQTLGIVVHAAAHGLGRGLSETEVSAEIESYLSAQDHLPAWQLARTRRAVTAMTSAIAQWISAGDEHRRFLGSEVPLDLALPDTGAPNPVRLAGRIDWLSERKDDGSAVVTDFKTGVAQPTKADVVEHVQLATYQLRTAGDQPWLDPVEGAELDGQLVGPELGILRDLGLGRLSTGLEVGDDGGSVVDPDAEPVDPAGQPHRIGLAVVRG